MLDRYQYLEKLEKRWICTAVRSDMDANIGRREKSNCFFPSFLPQRVTTGVIFYSEVVFPRIRRVPRTRIDTTKPEKDAEWNNLRGRYTREFLSKKRIYKKKEYIPY